VTVANAFLALAFLRRRPWAGCLGAGAALGLAFMSKGPVAFVQTIVPFAAFLAWRHWIAQPLTPSPGTPGEGGGEGPSSIGSRQSAIGNYEDPPSNPLPEYREREQSSDDPPRLWLPALAGFALMLLVGLPWFAWVVRQYPTTLSGWWVEVTRVGATQLPPDPWYTYFVFFVWTVPWLPWLVAGLWVGATQVANPPPAHQGTRDRAWRDGTVAALLLTLVPLVVMSAFKDKNERYTLPMLAPAAVLAARAAVGWWATHRDERARDPAGRAVEGLHWATLAVLAVGFPIAGPLLPKFGAGEPWFNGRVAVATALAAVPLLVLGLAARRRAAGGRAAFAAVAATLGVMLVLQVPATHGYGRVATSDLKPLADAVWAEYPDARVYQYEPGGRTRVRMDLPIYLGRTTRAVGGNDLPKSQTDRPQVVVFLARHANKMPQLPPPWKELASGAGRKGGWRAFVLPAAAAP
jgi:4-amino-4-deoxy-L-arabinose transferase-like glycosyltransferase